MTKARAHGCAKVDIADLVLFKAEICIDKPVFGHKEIQRAFGRTVIDRDRAFVLFMIELGIKTRAERFPFGFEVGIGVQVLFSLLPP